MISHYAFALLVLLSMAVDKSEFLEDLDKNITDANCMLCCLSLCEARISGEIADINSTLRDMNKNFSIPWLNHIAFSMIQRCMDTINKDVCEEFISNNTIVYTVHNDNEKYCEIDYKEVVGNPNTSYYDSLFKQIPSRKLMQL